MNISSKDERGGGKGLRLVLLGLIAAGLVAIWMLIQEKPETTKPAPSGNATANNNSGQATPPWRGASATAPRDAKDVDPEATPKIDAWLSERFDLPDPELIDGLLEFSRRRDIAMIEKAKALEHALNLIPDQEYKKLDVLIKDPATPASMLGTIHSDMHNRNEKAAIHASLLFLTRAEAEVAANGKARLAHLLDMDDESDTEAIRMQGETRLIELAEAEKEMDAVELAPDAEPPPPETPGDPAESPEIIPLPAPVEE